MFHQVVLLAGQVSSTSLKIKAETIAQRTAKVDRVYDQLDVGQPISMKQQSLDAWITSEISAKMLTAKGFRSGAIKVVTNSSVVYLMGIVKKKQAEKAVKIARNTNSVGKVVKVFQYIV